MSKEEDDKPKPTDTDLLVAIGEKEAVLSQHRSKAYATVTTRRGRRTFQVLGPGCSTWLRLRFRDQYRRTPSAGAVKAAITALADLASLADETPVWLRSAWHEGRVYIDLGDESGCAIEISADGWRLTPFPPVLFVRSNLGLPLPRPGRDDDLDRLRGLLNIPDDATFQLIVTWCVAALMPHGPYPLITIGGEQGAGKTLLAGVLHALVDPSRLPLRALPRSERDLYIACSNTHVLAYDNISKMPDWLSDAFCKVATGGGMALRQVFSDDAEVYFSATKPIILNAIEDVVTRPDLADRAIILNLPAIAEEKRIDPAEFAARFEECRPEVFKTLLDLMSFAMAVMPTLQVERLPRMAGFARIGIAIEGCFGAPGCFMAAYDSNRAMASSIVAESDPIVAPIRVLAATRPVWRGTATELASLLETRLVPPRRLDPAALGGHLRRIAPILRADGIEISFSRDGKGRDRLITVARISSSKP
ncbi:MAG: hypothetical protein C0458_18640 [Methylobacterium sp.]|nr:hypothetical protein [Methylobacterium sp.]